MKNLPDNFIPDENIDWHNLVYNYSLSESFIEKYIDKVDWYCISVYQKLSEEFIEKHSDLLDVDIAKKSNDQPNTNTRIERAKDYAKKHNLEIDDRHIYAFRNHNNFGNGAFRNNVYYEPNTYYRDWHCDPRYNKKNSFGLGIFPKGNTKVRVKLEDFCVEVSREDGKSRVWGFEIV